MISEWNKKRKTGANKIWKEKYLEALFDGVSEQIAIERAEKEEQKHWNKVRINHDVFIDHLKFIDKGFPDIMKHLKKVVLPRPPNLAFKEFVLLGRLEIRSFIFEEPDEETPQTYAKIAQNSPQWHQQAIQIAKPSKFSKSLRESKINSNMNSHALIGDIVILEQKIKGKWVYKTGNVPSRDELIKEHGRKLILIGMEGERISKLKDKEKARYSQYFFIQFEKSSEFAKRRFT